MASSASNKAGPAPRGGSVRERCAGWARPRVLPAGLGLACVAGGLAVRKLAPTGTIVWQHGALVLWCWVVFACVRFVSPRLSVPRAAAWMLAISVGVELAQLTRWPREISARHPLLRLVFGEVFSAWDLLICVVAFAALLVGWRLGRAVRARGPGAGAT